MWQEAQGEDDRRSLTEVTHWECHYELKLCINYLERAHLIDNVSVVLANSFPANVTANFHSKFMGFWLDKDVAEVNRYVSLRVLSHPQIHELYYRFICASGMDLYPLDFKAAGLLGNLKYLQLEDWANQKKQKTAV
ncbi:hypothetical protein CK203_059517 [Vitis vinifera]|uniref:Uncharacterized protein n=1 Tax=Vitis vinifera TaxID=29760 RepID=A0A438GJ09_VITVI|nr:hypothetical protein CK203_059517 [Vitis vinifera]